MALMERAGALVAGWIEVAGGERRLGGGEEGKATFKAAAEQPVRTRTSSSQPPGTSPSLPRLLGPVSSKPSQFFQFSPNI